jgi:hypothetical protein
MAGAAKPSEKAKDKPSKVFFKGKHSYGMAMGVRKMKAITKHPA